MKYGAYGLSSELLEIEAIKYTGELENEIRETLRVDVGEPVVDSICIRARCAGYGTNRCSCVTRAQGSKRSCLKQIIRGVQVVMLVFAEQAGWDVDTGRMNSVFV